MIKMHSLSIFLTKSGGVYTHVSLNKVLTKRGNSLCPYYKAKVIIIILHSSPMNKLVSTPLSNPLRLLSIGGISLWNYPACRRCFEVWTWTLWWSSSLLSILPLWCPSNQAFFLGFFVVVYFPWCGHGTGSPVLSIDQSHRIKYI